MLKQADRDWPIIKLRCDESYSDCALAHAWYQHPLISLTAIRMRSKPTHHHFLQPPTLDPFPYLTLLNQAASCLHLSGRTLWYNGLRDVVGDGRSLLRIISRTSGGHYRTWLISYLTNSPWITVELKGGDTESSSIASIVVMRYNGRQVIIAEVERFWMKSLPTV
jgi:hypothetical protein